MFLIRFLRFIFGYVVFSGSKGFPERFINLCSQKGINIWDVKCVSGKLSAKTNIKSYKNIRSCARKSGMKLKITKKCGLPFILAPYMKRKGIFAGVAVSFAILILLTSTVWCIDVSGNEKFTDEQIIALAEQYGVYPGAFRNTIDKKYIKTKIKSTVDGISWFSINIDGGRVSLEVSESEGSNVIYDKETPCNIISGVEGELLKLDSYVGEPNLKVGSAVLKDDLLISGVKEKADGSSYFVHAKGVAVIRTKKQIIKELPLTVQVKKIEKEKIVPSASLFGVETPSFKESEYDLLRTEKKMISFRNVKLPVGMIYEKYIFLTDNEISLETAQASLLCSYLSFCDEIIIMTDAETESKNINISKKENSIIIEYNFINHQKTGIEQYFEVEQ